MRTSTFFAAAAAFTIATAQDLATALSGQEALSTLVDLLSQVQNTTDFLASQEDVTLFAPNNAALATILGTGGIFSLDQAGADPGLIEQILRYHLIRGAVPSSAVTAIPQFVPTYLNYSGIVLDGEVSGSNVTGGQVVAVNTNEEGEVVVTSGIKSESVVTVADIPFNNGIIHIIDALLTIPLSDSVTLLTSNLTALAGAAITTDLVPTLEAASDLTIFAPNNDAFQAIAAASSTLSLSALADILTYHVIPGTVAYSVDLTNTTLPTLQGGEVEILIKPDGAVFVNNARVINADILTENGVVHVIDAVLNPDDPSASPDGDAFPTNGAAEPAPFTDVVGEVSTYAELSALAATTSFVAADLVSATATVGMGGSGNGSMSSAVVPPQQTGNAGAKGQVPALAAAVMGAVAFAVEL